MIWNQKYNKNFKRPCTKFWKQQILTFIVLKKALNRHKDTVCFLVQSKVTLIEEYNASKFSFILPSISSTVRFFPIILTFSNDCFHYFFMYLQRSNFWFWFQMKKKVKNKGFLTTACLSVPTCPLCGVRNSLLMCPSVMKSVPGASKWHEVKKWKICSL